MLLNDQKPKATITPTFHAQVWLDKRSVRITSLGVHICHFSTALGIGFEFRLKLLKNLVSKMSKSLPLGVDAEPY